MNYHRRRWSHFPREATKYSVLAARFGLAIEMTKTAFLNLEPKKLDQIMLAYGQRYGTAKEHYARQTYQLWKKGSTKLSGQTMEKLIELVPPCLSHQERSRILEAILQQNRKRPPVRFIRVNVRAPEAGFGLIKSAMSEMTFEDMLANLSPATMNAATWLYDDDVTVLRAAIADFERRENNILLSAAEREVQLLMRTITTGQVCEAHYRVEMPGGSLEINAYTPSLFERWFGRN